MHVTLNIRILVCSTLVLLIQNLCWCQKARLFTTNTELPSSLIFDIHQDKNDFIWIATEDGLCKYDGSKITTYTEDNSSILSNYIKHIYEDSHGRLFFGFFNGLQQYDHKTDSFSRIPLLMANGTPFDAHVMVLTERQNGDLLVGSSGLGMFILDSDSNQLVAHQMPEYVPGNLIRYIYEDANENLWISTSDEGLFRVISENDSTKYIKYGSTDVAEVSSIVQDPSGNIYFSTSMGSIFRYLNHIDHLEKIVDESLCKPITTMFVENGDLILGTDGGGIKKYDLKDNVLAPVHYNISNLDLSQAKVHSILKDNFGNRWLGLYQKGVAVVPSSQNQFQYIGHQSIQSNLIGEKYTMSVTKDSKGTLWIGTDGDGLFSLTDHGRNKRSYGKARKYKGSPLTVLTVYADSHDKLWVGSYSQGLSFFDEKSHEFAQFLDQKTGKRMADHISCITEDNANTIWVGTLGKGVFSVDLNTDLTKTYDSFSINERLDGGGKLHNDWVSSVFVSSKNTLFIGTYDGISTLDLSTGKFELMNETHTALRGKIIYSQCEDQHGHLWFGTSQGLFSFDPLTDSLIQYTAEDGLPNNVICAIEAVDDNLWLSTNYGLSKMKIKTKEFTNYYYQDGLQGNEFSKGSSFYDKNGDLYFTGINGVTYFDPKSIKSQNRQPLIQITGLYIDNKPVNASSRSGNYQITSSSISNTDKINLSHQDNSFTVEFSAMEFINPERISYEYSILGEEWIELRQGVNTVTFSNLEPDTYWFKVRAKDFNSYSEVKRLTIDIHEAWYFSIWAKLIYTLVALTIVSIVVFLIRQKLQANKVMRMHQRAKELNEAKLEFFINISHEIKTPISLIINPLMKLIKQDQDDKRQRDYFIMQRSAQRILKLVNQLLDIRRVDRGQLKMKFQEIDLVHFLQETCLIFDEQLHGKEIQFGIHTARAYRVFIDPNQFDKVIQNILSNAIKFTPQKGAITINLHDSTEDQQLIIEVTDSGAGIEIDELEKIFDRFYQTSLGSSSAEGTGIGLHLSKSIVELHHGKIEARLNTDGQGTTFIIHLPLGQSHLKAEDIDHSMNTQLALDRPKYFVPVSPVTSESQIHKSKTKTKVLIVDDDDEIRNYLKEEFSQDYVVFTSMNGEEAYLEVIRRQPDLIISDVVMPKMDGNTLSRKVKQNVNVNHIPIILLTAKSQEEDNLKGLETGADAYISKPFNIELLKKTCSNLIKNRQLLKNNFKGNQLQEDKLKEVEMQSTDDVLMQKIMAVVNDNIDNPELNVELIASEIGFSRVHLHRKLKEITNQSARDLIKNIRLKQAGDLLSSKQISIAEVAYAVGFSSPAKFSTHFKAFYGESPTSFVEKHQEKPQ